MPAAERSPSTTSATSTPTSGRRLISKLTSPFAHKSRNLTDFYVHIDDPLRQYSPGDLVTGYVNLKVVKPTRVTHVVVCLHGFVQVYKNPGSPPSDSYRGVGGQVGTGRGSKTGEYFGNGFATLFEDEVVLCGDGRLGEGVYQFQFELMFPDRDLPSSISFERGTISYLATATLTRPTTISPTIQCDHKVYFVERIDISQLVCPKPRTITLEPISRRSRAKTQAKRLKDNAERMSRKEGSTAQTSSERDRRESQSSSAPSSQPEANSIRRSPSPSENSFDYDSTGMSRPSDSNATSPRQSDAEKTNSRVSLLNRTITAQVESLTGGCLRGDSIPIRVHVNHTKHVKSLHGVIITLYRQARVDLHPSIPLGPTEKGKEAKYEDYYPKSVTGLGGLSLSGAGSSHMFRKDLSQTIVPLIVDPGSLTAEVTGRVHVPEEAFPTISTVPGAMISFKYYVEVVLDIQGKLQSQDRNLGNLGGLASTIAQGHTSEGGMHRETTAMNPFGSPVIDTSVVRRDKGVVACTFEVVIGTRDSSRKGKKKVVVTEADTPVQSQAQPDTRAGAENGQSNGYHGEYWEGGEGEYGYDYGHGYGYDQQYYDHAQYNGHNGYMPPQTDYLAPPPLPVPMPQVEDESQLSEKERIRRAEQRLLPSQPPGAEESGSSSRTPTAPHLPDELPNGHMPSAPPPALLTPPAFTSGPSHTNGISSMDYARNIPLPRTPEYEPREEEANDTPRPTDDKRELQRRDLEAEASAPPMDDAQPSTSTAPSAPMLTEDDLYGTSDVNDSHADASASSELPRYER